MRPGTSLPRLVGRCTILPTASVAAEAPVRTSVVAGLRTSGLRSMRCTARAGRMSLENKGNSFSLYLNTSRAALLRSPERAS